MIVYLDTSSLVKLYVAEPGSEAVQALVAAATVVATSQVAYPEARAALARRRRERALDASGFKSARQALDNDWPGYLAIDAGAALCREAGDLAERFKLRGFDAIHLASLTAIWRQSGQADVRFASFDQSLVRAAASLTRRARS